MNSEEQYSQLLEKGNYDHSPHSCSVRFENITSRHNISRDSRLHCAKSGSSYQPSTGWLTPCNTGLKVISAQ